MIDILTGTPFDAPKRLNHREDEVALEFPSSVDSRARGLLALKATNWRVAKKSVPNARDYVQGGLVAMWDGKENAGWGVHDATATTWKDLVGGNDFVNIGNGRFLDDSARMYSAIFDPLTAGISIDVTGEVTIEIVTSGYGINGVNPFAIGILKFRRYVSGGVAYALLGKTQYLPEYPEKFPASISITYNNMIASRITIDNARVNVTSKMDYENSFFQGIEISSNYSESSRLYSFRVYAKGLTDAESAHNYAVDKARFGLA